jgi:hypothetical protein
LPTALSVSDCFLSAIMWVASATTPAMICLTLGPESTEWRTGLQLLKSQAKVNNFSLGGISFLRYFGHSSGRQTNTPAIKSKNIILTCPCPYIQQLAIKNKIKMLIPGSFCLTSGKKFYNHGAKTLDYLWVSPVYYC